MVWYPSVDDIICLNVLALDLSDDKHPHKLLGVSEGIQAILDKVIREEARGLTYQAALLMKELVMLHPFAGGNHRTAYAAAKSFLRRNGRRLRIDRFSKAYPFIKDLENRSVGEIQDWIEHGGQHDA
jgi:prophage maintenance system killer protein